MKLGCESKTLHSVRKLDYCLFAEGGMPNGNIYISSVVLSLLINADFSENTYLTLKFVAFLLT